MSAQSIGGWKLHPVFGNNIQNIIDTGSKVFFLTDEYLYSYDKEGKEIVSYSKQTNLSDIRIDDIYYNYDKKYLVVTYSNGNIDLIDNAGKVINIPDIYNATIKASKTINDVFFSGDKIYVATDFGYVVLDANKYETIESRAFNVTITQIGIVGSKILLGTKSKLYMGDLSSHYMNLSDYKATLINEGGRIYPISDTSFMFITGWGYKATLQNDNVVLQDVIPQVVHSFKKSLNGYTCYAQDGSLITLDANGSKTATSPMPQSFSNSIISSYESDGSYWVLSTKGVAHIKAGTDGSETVMTDFFRPNSSTVKIPFYLVYNNSQKKLYVWNTGTNTFFSDTQVIGAVSTYDGSFWKDIAPASAPTLNSNQNNNKLNSPYSPVFDPDDPTTYYVGTWYEGAYKITDGKVVTKYDWNNSPIVRALNGYYSNVNQIAFDKNKNMWFFQPDNTSAPIMVLPRAKQSQTTLTSSDWTTLKVNGMQAKKMMHFLVTSKDIKLYTAGDYKDPLIVFNDNGNPAGTITSKLYSTLTDQDGKEFSWQNIYCFVEDLNGKVWMGTNVGVIELNPSNALNASFSINHLKVPRNDGTNYADYLLNDTPVTCIAVDGSNRKWLGTSTSGLFLVSADGSVILKQFTTENSSLTSNKVISIACNPNNNSVYVGTEDGLLEYASDAAPSAQTYSDVYAYPNPVRPEYTGMITIRGLMDNSLVKIADAAGNVFKSMRSNGGMATWDGCNASGERVKSGVYYVLASQNENESSSGVVTKILVIR